MEKTTEGIIRIAIVGPESTGKSTLAVQLAEYYNTTYAPEYAREYIDKLNRPYTFEDITEISKGQIEQEDKAAAKANHLLFCDTNLLVTKIWAEHKYGHCPEWILNEIKSRKYSLYLLCNIDIPWEADPQREHPHLREHLFEKYLSEVKKSGVPYVIISGLQKERTENAIKAVDKLLATA
jgi:NadR type nicotinamide-nucleotide adenylyltransferase